jgi:hypothetical protein
VHAKGVDLRAVCFQNTSTTEAPGRVFLEWPVPISRIEGASENADGIVVCLLAPVMSVCDGDQAGVADFVKNELADLWPPNTIEYLSIRSLRRSCQIVPLKTCLAMGEVFVEDFIA